MEIEGIKIDDQVDITDKVCPLTFVKAKLVNNEDGTYSLIVKKVED